MGDLASLYEEQTLHSVTNQHHIILLQMSCIDLMNTDGHYFISQRSRHLPLKRKRGKSLRFKLLLFSFSLAADASTAENEVMGICSLNHA